MQKLWMLLSESSSWIKRKNVYSDRGMDNHIPVFVL